MSDVPTALQKGGDSIGETVIDLGVGLWEGTVENPLNGALQMVNNVANVHLPEVHLGDQEPASGARSAGRMIGAMLDVALLSRAAGGLGGAGVAGSALRMGAVGAFYSGVLTPTDGKSQNFFSDRLKNGAVGAVTFAGMGATAGAIDAVGIFAAPAARSFAGSIAYGALSGGIGGAIGAEANAVIRDNKPVPTFDELKDGVTTGALFGAAIGATGYAYNALTRPKPLTVVVNHQEKVRLWTDNDGNPVRVQALDTRFSREDLAMNGTKMSNGKWSAYRPHTLMYDAGIRRIPLAMEGLKAPDGSILLKGEGFNYTFAPGGGYVIDRNISVGSWNARVVTDNQFNRVYQEGKITQIGPNRADPNYDGNHALLEYDKTGALSSVRLRSQGTPTVEFNAGELDGRVAGSNNFKVTIDSKHGAGQSKSSQPLQAARRLLSSSLLTVVNR